MTTATPKSGETGVLWEQIKIQRGAPVPRCNAAAATCGGKLFLFGGKALPTSTAKSFNDLHAFDSTFFTWENIKPTDGVHPPPRNSHTLLSYGDNQLILFGGCEGNVALNDLWIYSINENVWKKIKASGQDRPKPVNLHSSVVYNDTMYVYGGWMSDWGRNEKMWKLDIANMRWDSISLPKGGTVPERRFGHIATVFDDSMYVFGGAKSVGPTNELWKYTFSSNRWTNLNPSGGGPSPRKLLGCVQFEKHWLVIGGCLNDDVSYSDAWQYNFEKNAWALSTPFATDEPNDSHCCVVVNRPCSDMLVMTTGRVKKESSNDVYILGVFRNQAITLYEENREVIRQIQDIASIPPASLEDLALMLLPVAKHRWDFAASLRETLNKIADGAVPEPLQRLADNAEAPIESQKRIFSLIQTLLGLEKSALKYRLDGRHEGNDAAAPPEITVEQASQSLLSFLSKSGLDDISVADNIVAAAGDNSQKLPSLAPPSQQFLRSITEPLELLDDQMKKLWHSYVQPSIDAVEVPGGDKAIKLIEDLKEEGEKLEAELYDVSYQLTDVTLPIRERHGVHQKKIGVAISYLMNLDSKVSRLAGELEETPVSIDVSLSKLRSETASFLKALKDKEKEHCGVLDEIGQSLKRMETLQEETVATREAEEANFELKRKDFAATRSQLVNELKEFTQKTLEEFAKLLEDEKEEMLNVEKKRREENEMRRQIAEFLDKIEPPYNSCKNAVDAYQNSSGFASEMQGKVHSLLATLQHRSVQSGKLLASEALKCAFRYPAVAEAVVESLEKSLEGQEKALNKLEDQMKAKMAKLELLENAGDPEELGRDDDGSESSYQPTKGHAGINDPLLTEALSYGVHEGSTDSYSPYQSTLLKYNQYKQLYERLQSDVEALKNRIAEIQKLSATFQVKLQTLKDRTEATTNPDSFFRLLLADGFSWDDEGAKVVKNEIPNEEWLRSVYNVDRAAKPPHNVTNAAAATEVTSRNIANQSMPPMTIGHSPIITKRSIAGAVSRSQNPGEMARSFAKTTKTPKAHSRVRGAPGTPPPHGHGHAHTSATPVKRKVSHSVASGGGSATPPSFMMAKHPNTPNGPTTSGGDTRRRSRREPTKEATGTVNKERHRQSSRQFDVNAASQPRRTVRTK